MKLKKKRRECKSTSHRLPGVKVVCDVVYSITTDVNAKELKIVQVSDPTHGAMMAKPAPNKKDVAKLQIYAKADHLDEFTAFYKSLGMNQREAGSRLFAWFNRQSPLIRQQILQPLPEEVAPDIARILLERMAEQDRLRQGQPKGDGASPTTTTQETPPQSLSVLGKDHPTR